MLKIGEVLIMLIFCPFLEAHPPPPIGPQTINMINIINISPVLSTFWKKRINMINMINISSVLSIFCSKCAEKQGKC